MSSSVPFPQQTAANQPFGLPQGSVRGFLSVLICALFWIVLLLPDMTPKTVPIAHFFLLTLVFLAFASNPHVTDISLPMLPWLMRLLFVGGSVAVIGYVAYAHPDRLVERLTPDPAEIKQWPTLLATVSLSFAAGLFLRYILGPSSHFFQTLRGWIGVLAVLALIIELVLQFIIANMETPPRPDGGIRIWEATIVGLVAAYFGTRA